MTKTENKSESKANGKASGISAQVNQAEAPVINMRGAKVGLGPLTRAAIPAMSRWENDFAVTVWSGDAFEPRSREEAEADYDRRTKSERRNWHGFMIYELATMRHIGDCHLRGIDFVHGTAEMGIMIGEPDCWGKGYGTEAVILLLDFAFTALNLHNVMLDTSSYNERALGAYRRAGFREIGRRRESKRIGGISYDVIFMDCLATEFKSPYPPVVRVR